jgi:glycosyltransferase involved in cell wall biosynthesis
MRVAAFTGGRTISSARFRVRQYIPYLREHGVDVDEFIARFGSWPPRSQAVRPFWLAATLAQRMPDVLRSYNYDAVLLQREMVSTLVTLERLTKSPRILDLDDAVWLNRDTAFLARLTRMCTGVICGNEYIARHVRNLHDNVCVLPTGVDTTRYRPGSAVGDRIVGWSGLAVGLKWLYRIETALAAILERHPGTIVRVVSDEPPHFSILPPHKVEYIRWSPAIEVRSIQEMTVGLMPLEDSAFARGKCSYKMLLYMSCGVPVVVSPVGMNVEVLARGRCGFAATGMNEWIDAIDELLSNPDAAAAQGREGRSIVERDFSLNVLTPRFASFLKRSVPGDAVASPGRET